MQPLIRAVIMLLLLGSRTLGPVATVALQGFVLQPVYGTKTIIEQ
jgi:hypothetical protein